MAACMMDGRAHDAWMGAHVRWGVQPGKFRRRAGVSFYTLNILFLVGVLASAYKGWLRRSRHEVDVGDLKLQMSDLFTGTGINSTIWSACKAG